jgi:citrate lyase beta subunit
MKYFDFIENKDGIFYKTPMEFNMFTSKEILSHCLGATLYMSGLRKDLINDIQITSAGSVVVCLEDAVATDKLEAAEQNVLSFFKNIENLYKINNTFLYDIPLIFLRIRNLSQFKFFLNNSSLIGLCGFIFPKFDLISGEDYFKALKQYNTLNNRNLYCMPILETREVIYKEYRIDNLLKLKKLFDKYRNLVLNIRIGGTDFSGIYGLRRDKHHTIYDLSVINDCIGDIINIFKIDDYVISAPVNEHFDIETGGFIKEILLDKMNGLIGKTVIHPNQVNIVNSLTIISKEEYLDAKSIISSSSDGVIKSIYSNKMNEIKPHLQWAHHIIILSKILGVLNHGKDYRDLINLEKNIIYKSKFENILEY